MSLWWLSFCDASRPEGSQFLGVAIVEAEDMASAVVTAHANGCNPGGEVEGYVIPVSVARHVPTGFQNLIMDRSFAEALGRVLSEIRDSERKSISALMKSRIKVTMYSVEYRSEGFEFGMLCMTPEVAEQVLSETLARIPHSEPKIVEMVVKPQRASAIAEMVRNEIVDPEVIDDEIFEEMVKDARKRFPGKYEAEFSPGEQVRVAVDYLSSLPTVATVGDYQNRHGSVVKDLYHYVEVMLHCESEPIRFLHPELSRVDED